MSKVTYTAKIIATLIKAEMEDTTQAEQVAAVLKRFDGKALNKRFATAVHKALPELTVHWNTNYGMFHIDVWGKGTNHDERRSYLVGYASTKGPFSYDRFLEHCACYLSAAKVRNEERSKLLADSTWLTAMADAINRLNAARVDVKRLTEYPNPEGHELQALAGL